MKDVQDFCAPEGTSRYVRFTLTNKSDGAPYDATGVNFHWVVVRNDEGPIILEKTSDQIAVLQNDDEACVVQVTINASDFPRGTADCYPHYFETTNLGAEEILAKGTATITVNPLAPAAP